MNKEINKEIDEINDEIMKLRDKKKTLKNKKLINNKNKKEEYKNNWSNANRLIRVSNNFDNEIIDVQNKRIEFGIDSSFTSKPSLTNLIIKHRCWREFLKEDLIKFQFEVKNVE